MPSNIPATQERLEPFYMGQLGVDGSDVPLGIKTGIGNVIYVGTAAASNLIEPLDGNDGTRWNSPKAAVQAALDACVDGQGDMVCLLPGSYVLTEALTMTKDRVRLFAWDWDKGAYAPSVVIQSNTYDHDLLEIDANQCEIAGIRWANSGTGAFDCIKVAVNSSVIGLDIHDCRFSYGRSGIFVGAGGVCQDFNFHDSYFVAYNSTANTAGIVFMLAMQGLVEDNYMYTGHSGTYNINFTKDRPFTGVMIRRNDLVVQETNGVAIYRASDQVIASMHHNYVSGGPAATTAITQRNDGGACAVNNYCSSGVGGVLIDATT